MEESKKASDNVQLALSLNLRIKRVSFRHSYKIPSSLLTKSKNEVHHRAEIDDVRKELNKVHPGIDEPEQKVSDLSVSLP